MNERQTVVPLYLKEDDEDTELCDCGSLTVPEFLYDNAYVSHCLNRCGEL